MVKVHALAPVRMTLQCITEVNADVRRFAAAIIAEVLEHTGS
jgi:hypothetical protein